MAQLPSQLISNPMNNYPPSFPPQQSSPSVQNKKTTSFKAPRFEQSKAITMLKNGRVLESP